MACTGGLGALNPEVVKYAFVAAGNRVSWVFHPARRRPEGACSRGRARTGKTSHAFILDAIAQTVEQSELDDGFHRIADKRWATILVTGKTARRCHGRKQGRTLQILGFSRQAHSSADGSGAASASW
jgi:hypothetical protein